ncbi:MAG: methyltransferase domain-containing protein [Deltaproteobacteria bacterium]|nr:MAG: methyltransferase domain-containing protein [Deltaproteobacteria bacterium]
MLALLLAIACAHDASRDPAASAEAAPPVQTPPPAEHAHHPGGDDAVVHHSFHDAERWVQVFDDPGRAAWQKPAELVAALEIQPGSTVADIGAGTGYFNRYLAEAVGPEGHVVAIDIEPSMVEHMARRAVQEGTPQVEARLGRPDDPGLKPGEADLVLMVDTYHHIDGRVSYFAALRDRVAPGGRLVVVDFKPGDLPVGPPPGHRISQEQVVDELTRAGWTIGDSLDILPYQYVQVAWRDGLPGVLPQP